LFRGERNAYNILGSPAQASMKKILEESESKGSRKGHLLRGKIFGKDCDRELTF